MAILVFCISLGYFDFERFQVFEYSLLLMLSVFGMFVLVSVNDFILLYLSVELQSFCFYVLAGLKRYSNLSIEAGLKYFILGSFASALLLFGISLIYGFFGTLNFNEVYYLFFFDSGLLLAVLFITVGILFKLGLVPFHFWLPDVYEGSPMIVTTMFAVLTKFSFLVLFVKLYYFVFFGIMYVFNYLFLFLGLLSIVFGSIMSLYQTKIKRLLAYSGISHMGFMFIALSLFSVNGLFVFLVYFLIYIVLSVGIFSVVLAFRVERNFYKLRNLVEFSSLLKANFFLAVIFSFILLSFAGVPPLSGFFGKFLLFHALVESNNYFLALSVLLLSVLTTVYYIRLIRFVFFNDYVSAKAIFPIRISAIHAILLIFSFFFNVLFFFFQGPLLVFLNNLSVDILYFILCIVMI